jgi:citryl-CoA lyase
VPEPGAPLRSYPFITDADRAWLNDQTDLGERWSTAISLGLPETKLVAGYPVVDLTGNVSYVETVYLVLRGELPDERTRNMLEACLTSVIDQGFRNTAALTARFAASANPNAISAIVAGLLAVGPVAIGVQRDVVALIDRGMQLRRTQNMTLEGAAEATIHGYLAEHQPVPGFGSPLHRTLGYDPRAERLRTLAEHFGFTADERYRFFSLVHAELERARGRPVTINIDGVMGAIFAALGFDEHATAALEVLVILPALIGHAVEEIRRAPHIRNVAPASVEYTGPPPRELPPERRRV